MAEQGGPELRLECLVRQLSEVELLESMFPDEFQGDVSSAAAAAEAAEDAGALPEGVELEPLTFTITVVLEELPDSPELRLGFTLPLLYPRAAPQVVTGIAGLTRGAREQLAAALMATGKERTEHEGEEGEECVCELVQQGQELAAEMVAAEAEAAAAAELDSAEDSGPLTQCVVKIEHMNDSKNYMKSLKKWCEQLGLAARVYYREAGTAKAAGRVEAVVVVLEGPEDGVRSWLTRLRSEYVDVDGRGGKCKERKSTVICRREADTATGNRLDGWETMVYEEEGTLETALAGMDLLHVGLGATRWGGGGGASLQHAEPEPEPEQQVQSNQDQRLGKLSSSGAEVAAAAAAGSAGEGAPPAYLEVIGLGSVMTRVHLSIEVSTGKQQTTLTNAAELAKRSADVARFDVAAQPRNGAANKEICAHMAKALGVRQADVSLASGGKARQKMIAVEGLPVGEVEARLLDAA